MNILFQEAIRTNRPIFANEEQLQSFRENKEVAKVEHCGEVGFGKYEWYKLTLYEMYIEHGFIRGNEVDIFVKQDEAVWKNRANKLAFL